MKRTTAGAVAALAVITLAGCGGGKTVSLSMSTTGDSATATVSINGDVQTFELTATKQHAMEFRGSLDDIDEFRVTGDADLTCRIDIDGENVSHVWTETSPSNGDDHDAEVVCIP